MEPCLTRLSKIHRALQQLHDIHFHHVDNDAIIAYSRTDLTTGDSVLVVCTLDSHAAQSGTTSLDMPALGLGWTDRVTVHDEVSGETWDWGQFNHVAHVVRIER